MPLGKLNHNLWDSFFYPAEIIYDSTLEKSFDTIFYKFMSNFTEWRPLAIINNKFNKSAFLWRIM